MIRLHLDADYRPAGRLTPSPEQAHYLLRVMRLGLDAALHVFNGRDGEWRARVAEIGKRGCVLVLEHRVRPQAAAPDVELIVALVKRPRLETIVEKAVELGASRVRLVVTSRTNAERANIGRLAAIATEAAEQTGRLDIPLIAPPEPLAAILAAWPTDRRLLFCDEAGEAPPVATALAGAARGPWALLIGPEGGFSLGERASIRDLAAALPVSLGPRILRADTAAIAALTLWQAMVGDWRGELSDA